jgi:hypothetical protein
VKVNARYDLRVAREQFWNRHVTLRWQIFRALRSLVKRLLRWNSN